VSLPSVDMVAIGVYTSIQYITVFNEPT